MLQLLLNGLMAGSVLALPALAFSIIYAVRRFLNFSVGAHMTVGAFAGYVANTAWGLPLAWAVPVAFVAAGLVGVLTERLFLQPLARSGAMTIAIASIALGLVLDNVLRFVFGNALRSYDVPVARDWVVHGLRIGPQQLDNLLVAVAVVLAISLFMLLTPAGKAIRAVADNPVLADAKGIDPHAVGSTASLVAMGLAGIGGLLLGMETTLEPEMGYRSLLPVFAAAVLGGLGSLPGAVLGALLIGLAEELSLLVFPATYRTVVGFAVILLVLLLRPQGLLGRSTGR